MTEPRSLSDALPDTLARLEAKYGAGAEAYEPGPVDLVGLPTTEELAASSRRRYWSAVVPSRFAWAELEQIEPAVRPELEEWAAHPDGRNLVILGAVGTGKTHAALAAARARVLAGAELKFLPVVELLDHLRPGGPEGALWNLCEVDLLVIDDLGAERPTDWTAERLGALINRRWMEERPTVVTTNLERPALTEALGERAYSRLTGNGTLALRLSGNDRRKARP